jgi:hypothetical protein
MVDRMTKFDLHKIKKSKIAMIYIGGLFYLLNKDMVHFYFNNKNLKITKKTEK